MWSKKKEVLKPEPDYIWKGREMVWFVFKNKKDAVSFSKDMYKNHNLKGGKGGPRYAHPNASKFAVKVTHKEYENLAEKYGLTDIENLLPAYNSKWISDQMNAKLPQGNGTPKIVSVDVDVKESTIKQGPKESKPQLNVDEGTELREIGMKTYVATFKTDKALKDENATDIVELLQKNGAISEPDIEGKTITLEVLNKGMFQKVMDSLATDAKLTKGM